jgi:ubiquinone/menaquinone biosynthesis C-methylase UbiE
MELTSALIDREIVHKAQRIEIMLEQIRRMVPRPIKQMYRFGVNRYARLNPSVRTREKYKAELGYWRGQLDLMLRWYEGHEPHWYGLPSPREDQKSIVSEIPSVNAIITSHQLRPVYLERLQLSPSAFRGKRVLEVGCGPLAPILVFEECVRHGIDPLINQYIESGWPLYALDVIFTKSYGEKMPYPDEYFDAIISCNALDHVDDFGQVASEMQRVLKKGGRMYFEVEYHKATVTEPIELTDSIIMDAFLQCRLNKVMERGKLNAYEATCVVSPGASNEDRLVLWHGEK